MAFVPRPSVSRRLRTPSCSLPTLRAEEDLVLDLLNEDGVLVHPGYFFDFPRESFLVVSLLVPDGSFTTGAERLFRRAVP